MWSCVFVTMWGLRMGQYPILCLPRVQENTMDNAVTLCMVQCDVGVPCAKYVETPSTIICIHASTVDDCCMW